MRVQALLVPLGALVRVDTNPKDLQAILTTSEPTIEVTFPWLILPLVLYVMITTFFFTTMSRTRNAPPWKSSALALLSCTDPNNMMGETEQFKRTARTTSVRLEDNGETWHLHQARSEK